MLPFFAGNDFPFIPVVAVAIKGIEGAEKKVVKHLSNVWIG